MSAELSNLSIRLDFKPSTFPTDGPAKKIGTSRLSEDVADVNYEESSDDNVTTTAAALPLGKVVTPRRLWVQNIGAVDVNFCSTSGGTYDVTCKAGSQIFVGWLGAAIYRKSASAIGKIRYVILGA